MPALIKKTHTHYFFHFTSIWPLKSTFFYYEFQFFSHFFSNFIKADLSKLFLLKPMHCFLVFWIVHLFCIKLKIIWFCTKLSCIQTKRKNKNDAKTHRHLLQTGRWVIISKMEKENNFINTPLTTTKKNIYQSPITIVSFTKYVVMFLA